MSLGFPPSLNNSFSYVQPGQTTYYPDGSYRVEQASYYNQQQGGALGQPFYPAGRPFNSPVGAGAKEGVRQAFLPKQLGFDALLGAGFALGWKGYYALRNQFHPERYALAARSWHLDMIPLMLIVGIVFRGAQGAFQGYKHAKGENKVYW